MFSGKLWKATAISAAAVIVGYVILGWGWWIWITLLAFVILLATSIFATGSPLRRGRADHAGEGDLLTPSARRRSEAPHEEETPSAKPHSFGKWIVLLIVLVLVGIEARYVRRAWDIYTGKIAVAPTASTPATRAFCDGGTWGTSNDHRNQRGMSFNVAPTDVSGQPPCFSSFTVPPSDWQSWDKQFVSPNPSDCYAIPWFWGEPNPRPLFRGYDIPQYNGAPRAWRIESNCMLHYTRTS